MTEPGFSAPSSSFEAGRLVVQTTNNVDNFGYWESPLVDVFPAAADRDAPTTTTIYQAQFRVSSNVAKAVAPVIRLRTISADFQKADVLVATSPQFFNRAGKK